MGGAINCSFISTQFLLSAYFLTAQTYKHMRLITRVYCNLFLISACLCQNLSKASAHFTAKLEGSNYHKSRTFRVKNISCD